MSLLSSVDEDDEWSSHQINENQTNNQHLKTIT